MPDSPTTANARMDAAHREKHFENHIVEQLVDRGWRVGHTHDYDIERALHGPELAEWVKATQPAKWAKRCSSRTRRRWERLSRWCISSFTMGGGSI